MADQRTFDFRCTQPVAGDIQDIIDPANNPEIAIFITARAIAGEITAFEFAPILSLVPLLVTVDRAQHRRPRTPDDQFSAHVRPHFVPFFIDNGWFDTEEWKRCATRLRWNCTGKRRDQNRSGFSLPPRIDNGTTRAADVLIIPHPYFRINRFTDCPEQ